VVGVRKSKRLKVIKMNKIKKGDSIIVLVGKDRGKTGTVERVLVKENKVVIPGVNLNRRHVKGRQGIEGGIIDIVKPLDVSNVALVCKKCKKTTKVGILIENGEKKRICRKCKEVIA
jgi:large subunit ribosomal protein L24